MGEERKEVIRRMYEAKVIENIETKPKSGFSKRFSDSLKWKLHNRPLEERLKSYKQDKRERESVLYRYDYDIEIKGYGIDNKYKASIVLRRSLDDYNKGMLLWSCIDRISPKFINLSTYWEYEFNNHFIYKVLAIPTDKDEELWLLDAGRNIGIPIKVMREIVRGMKEYCKNNCIFVPDGRF